jgi:hypothetical protein
MAAHEPPVAVLDCPDICAHPVSLSGRVSSPAWACRHLLFNVVIHNRNVAKINHPPDRHDEALPFRLEGASDPLFLAQPTERPSAHEREAITDEPVEKRLVTTANGILEPVCQGLRIER